MLGVYRYFLDHGASGKYPLGRARRYSLNSACTANWRIFAPLNESGMVSGVIGNHAPRGPGAVKSVPGSR